MTEYFYCNECEAPIDNGLHCDECADELADRGEL